MRRPPCANSGSATIASVSASATFFATPIRNSTKPRDRFSHISAARGSTRNWWMISLCRTKRPGDELREERDEHAEIEEAVDVPVAAPEIDQVRDLLEDEEADAERQDQIPGLPRLAQHAERRAAQEVGIFEHGRGRRGSAPRRAPESIARASCRTIARSASWRPSARPAAARTACPTSRRKRARQARRTPAAHARCAAQQ